MSDHLREASDGPGVIMYPPVRWRRQLFFARPPTVRQVIAWLLLLVPIAAFVVNVVFFRATMRWTTPIYVAGFWFWWLPWVHRPLLIPKRAVLREHETSSASAH